LIRQPSNLQLVTRSPDVRGDDIDQSAATAEFKPIHAVHKVPEYFGPGLLRALDLNQRLPD
jgi:hypothetical protein